MSRDFHVRIATPEDIDEVMEMAIASVEETGITEADPEMVLECVWPALNRYCGIVGIIGKPGERAEGCVLMGLNGIWYSRKQFIEEKFIYVRPEYRAENGSEGGRGTKLCEFSKQVADGINMPLVMGGTSFSSKTQGKRRLYSRMFGPQVGAFFIYETSGFDAEAAAPALAEG